MNVNRTRSEDRADSRDPATDEQAAPAVTPTTDGGTDEQRSAPAGARTAEPQRPAVTTPPPSGAGRTTGTGTSRGSGSGTGTGARTPAGSDSGAGTRTAGTDNGTPAGTDSGSGTGTDIGTGTGTGTGMKRPAGAEGTDTGTDADAKRERRDRDRDRDREDTAAAQPPATPPTAGRGTPTAASTMGSDSRTAQARGTATRTTEDIDQLNSRMERALGGFVDDPRRAVREADAVLDEAVRRLTRMVEERRDTLRGSWHGDNGDKTGTEELRVALTRYRDMTRELLNVG
ncbi:hypothetical protein OG552_10045 [Streptomyces sp. NBC_01476]|uniref:hypothetical protein n=1 Tax=Streptomyces sp. NBC_01476 TaxID=2903881 RepID=UPI002E320355|nr:hypothetical protein [Streptomyces sp. NBC_01476]